MMKALVLAEQTANDLSPATAKTLSAALATGAQVDILVVGKDCNNAAREASELMGVSKVLVADDELYAHGLAENVTALILPLMEGYDAFFAAATAEGKNIAPRLAALLDIQQLSGITAVVAPDTFERPIYAGNAIETVRSSQPKNVITVITTGFAGAQTGGAALVETLETGENPELSSFAFEELSSSDRPELTSARVVISGGRGLGSAEAFASLEPIANKLNAAIGASRAAVDAGYISNDFQVGQTGKIVAPDLYFALGISGAIQHVAGCKDAKVIVAINKDEDAPIFALADYGFVADLFDVLPELEEAL